MMDVDAAPSDFPLRSTVDAKPSLPAAKGGFSSRVAPYDISTASQDSQGHGGGPAGLAPQHTVDTSPEPSFLCVTISNPRASSAPLASPEDCFIPFKSSGGG